MDCAQFVPGPGADPLQVQACAAINFLTTRCISPNTTQSGVLNAQGVSPGAGGNCAGTYGLGQQKLNASSLVSGAKDPVFGAVTGLSKNAGDKAGEVCTAQTVTTQPAQYSTSTCVASTDTNVNTCSESLNTTIQTTTTVATKTLSCANGVLVNGYCQATSTGAAQPVYVCPPGQTLTGTNCLQTLTQSATPTYTCPPGQTLSGADCLAVSPAQLNSYSCPSGYTLTVQTASSRAAFPRPSAA